LYMHHPGILLVKAAHKKESFLELESYKKQIKLAQSMLSHLRKQVTFEEGEKGSSEPDMNRLCQNEEKAMSASLPCKLTKN
jgi:hypothetical protein